MPGEATGNLSSLDQAVAGEEQKGGLAMATAGSTVSEWWIRGDWFDVCRCDIPCPCEFAQPPSDGWCQGVLAYHIREGHYGDVQLDGLNVIALGSFEGNLWTGEAKGLKLGFFVDERADERQREALMTILGGQAGGAPGP